MYGDQLAWCRGIYQIREPDLTRGNRGFLGHCSSVWITAVGVSPHCAGMCWGYNYLVLAFLLPFPRMGRADREFTSTRLGEWLNHQLTSVSASWSPCGVAESTVWHSLATWRSGWSTDRADPPYVWSNATSSLRAYFAQRWWGLKCADAVLKGLPLPSAFASDSQTLA